MALHSTDRSSNPPLRFCRSIWVAQDARIAITGTMGPVSLIITVCYFKAESHHWQFLHLVALALEFEQSMQSIDPSVSMPYWEYGMDTYLYDSYSESPIFSDDWCVILFQTSKSSLMSCYQVRLFLSVRGWRSWSVVRLLGWCEGAWICWFRCGSWWMERGQNRIAEPLQ